MQLEQVLSFSGQLKIMRAKGADLGGKLLARIEPKRAIAADASIATVNPIFDDAGHFELTRSTWF